MVGTLSGIIFMQRGQDHDVRLFQGKTVNFSIVYGGSNPHDVTNFDAKLTVRKTASSATAEAEFTVTNGRVILGGVDGVIRFTMTATDTSLLTAGRYVYDIEITNASGEVQQIMSGRCQIVGEVSR